MPELFDAVDALIEGQPLLPPPAERERLRKAHGLTQEQVAKALEVRRATIVNWESGRTEPRPPQRQAYIRLLEKLSALYAAPSAAPSSPAAPPSSPRPVPQAVPPAPQADGSAPAPVPEPATPPADAPAAPPTAPPTAATEA
ncbi:MAG TPA: transcriptional regulator, partial [Streptomyces sp.]|nr:transcriptional regulator [Streptomyces sp.]